MKKFLKILLGIVLVAVLGLLIAGWLMNEKLPTSTPTAEADELARKMVASMNPAAWDTTYYVQWSFVGRHHYVWDRGNGQVEVKWADKRVVLQTADQSGRAYEAGQEQSGEAAEKLRKTAWSYFVNDNFWLIAPLKAFDEGTTRAIATTEDGETGLMVSYASGGVTPGDRYLWLLDDNFRPRAYKMWVQIVPVGGLEASWEGWTQLSTGAWAPTSHALKSMSIKIENLRGTHTIEELNLGYDPFAG